jgi:hypothetical protein
VGTTEQESISVNNEQLDRIERQLAAIAAHLGIGAKPAAGAFRAAAQVATDSDLDGQYGNPEIRRDPKDWKGESFVGRCFSDCPAEYLDLVANLNDWRAKKDDEAGAAGEVNSKNKPKDGHFARLDAARARGWAARARSAPRPKAPPRPAAEDPFGYGGSSNEDPLPFLWKPRIARSAEARSHSKASTRTR